MRNFAPKIVILLCAVILFLFENEAFAQYTSIYADPGGVRWNVLENNHYKVIYPQGLDSMARRYLFEFETTRGVVTEGMKIDPRKMPIILHPYSLTRTSNVDYTPSRIDIVTTPTAYSGYAVPWARQNALHYGRRAAQQSWFQTGSFRIIYYIVGEHSLVWGKSYPSTWFMRGDAGQVETDFTNAGPGRDATTLMYFRAAFLNGDVRDYRKWRYGSFKNYYPDRNSFGALIATAMRSNSDNYYYTGDMFQLFVDRWWHIIDPMKNVCIDVTGFTRGDNFWMGVNDYVGMWRRDYASRGEYTQFDYLAKPVTDGFHHEYHAPTLMDNGSVYAVLSGYKIDNQLVKIDSTGKKKRVSSFAPNAGRLVRKDGHTLIWTESIPDIRYEMKDWSVLRSFDTNTGRFKTITHRTRYFNPSYSAENDVIAVTEYPIDGTSWLVFLDPDKGNVLTRVKAPSEGQLKYTTWIQDTVYAGVVTEKGWGMFKLDYKNPAGGWSCEIEEQSRTMSQMKTLGDEILFESDLDGVNNIYTYSTLTKDLRKMTNSRFGAFDINVDTASNTLYYTDFDNNGYHPVKSSFDNLDWRQASFRRPFVHQYAEMFAAQAKQHVSLPTAAEDSLLMSAIDSIPSKRFIKGLHAFHIHSWAPFYFNIDRIKAFTYDEFYQMASLGVTLVAQNLLGTAVSTFGYSYHSGRHSGHANIYYSGLFPVFELSMDLNDRSQMETKKTDEGSYVVAETGKPFFDASLRVYTPLNLSRSGWDSKLIPEISVRLNNDRFPGDETGKSQINRAFKYGLTYYRYIPKTRMMMFPKLGFGLEAKGAFGRSIGSESGNMYYAKGYFYVPGFAESQGFKFTFTWQKYLSGPYYGTLDNFSKMPRGYKTAPLNNFKMLSLDYGLPIHVEADAKIFYFMRLSFAPFVDLGIDRTNDVKTQYCSFGLAALATGHVLRLGPELSLGLRYARYYDQPSGGGKNSFKCSTNIML